MSPRPVLACLLLASLAGAGFPLACASPPPAQAPPSGEAAASDASSAPATAPSPSTSADVAPAASSSTATATPSPAPAAEPPPPPCIGGEVVMGTCICPKGKGADATGHCGYPPCPRSASGGAVFRDEESGQCMECRPGTKPTKDGKCER